MHTAYCEYMERKRERDAVPTIIRAPFLSESASLLSVCQANNKVYKICQTLCSWTITTTTRKYCGSGQKFSIINKQKANHLAAQQQQEIYKQSQQLQQHNENRFVILDEKWFSCGVTERSFHFLFPQHNFSFIIIINVDLYILTEV